MLQVLYKLNILVCLQTPVRSKPRGINLRLTHQFRHDGFRLLALLALVYMPRVLYYFSCNFIYLLFQLKFHSSSITL